MPARMDDVQKLRQKSQSNNWEIKDGARSIILSRRPILPINKIRKAAVSATSIAILYTSDIILLLLS